MDDYTIEQVGDALVVRFVRRPERGLGALPAIVLAVPFLGPGVVLLLGLYAPWLLRMRSGGTGAADGRAVYYFVGTVFGAAFSFLGGVVVARAFVSRFGRSEIRVTRDTVRATERWGPIRLSTTRPTASIKGLTVMNPTGATAKPGAREPLMALEASFTDAGPLRLAMLYPRESMNRLARDLARQLPKWGAPRDVDVRTAPQGGAADEPGRPTPAAERKAAGERNASPVGWVHLVLGGAAAIAGMAYGVDQAACLALARPVQATVLESRANPAQRGRPPVTIRYAYVVDGKRYASEGLFATPMRGPYEDRIARRRQASLTTRTPGQAWYVAGEPARALLIREPSFGPAMISLVGSLFVLTGVSLLLAPRPGAPDDARRRAQAATWAGIGAAAIALYLFRPPGEVNPEFLAMLAVWLIVTAVLGARWPRRRGVE